MDNQDILKHKHKEWNKDKNIRVGDFIYLKDESQPRRVAHVYDDGIQPSDCNPSLYFGDGYMSYSGALDSFIPLTKIELTQETKQGTCWIFDKGISGAGRGKTFTVSCRVYKEV